MHLPKYSMGVGDRFGRQGKAQLQAFIQAREAGIDVTPVWNKSHREHTITGTNPQSVRNEADAAVKELGWTSPYFVDADHIRYDTVDEYIACSDFFTIDVADKIGTISQISNLKSQIDSLPNKAVLPDVDSPIDIRASDPARIVSFYQAAMVEAARIYEFINATNGSGNFVVEVSMDETEKPQTPAELLIILHLLKEQNIPTSTIAPKFTGRFNKGVDYVGDLAQFEKEFAQIVGVIRYAINEFGYSPDLKLSVHTGSDKFALYPVMRRVLEKHDAGVHLKTAGTTWLEEAAALACAGQNGWEIIREIYAAAYETRKDLCGPYAAVTEIDESKLPSPNEVNKWNGPQFAATIRHDQNAPEYSPNARQLMHLAFKIAAQMGPRFTDALDQYAETIAPNVTKNLLERHIKPLFGPS